jgi:hypothetical protein
MLSLWAGADPHAPAMSLRYANLTDDGEGDDGDRFLSFTAIHEACSNGDAQILERLGPDPSRDDFDELFAVARTGAIVKVLARRGLPRDVGKVICSQISWIILPFGRPRSLDTMPLRRLWEKRTVRAIADVIRKERSDSRTLPTIKLAQKISTNDARADEEVIVIRIPE